MQWFVASSQVPALIVLGSKDKHLGLFSTNNLRNLRNSHVVSVEDASHAVAQDKTHETQALLFNFLRAIQKHEQSR